MAAFDRSLGHVVVQVVYDGVTGSGKTANLTKLLHELSPQRRSEMVSPRRREGATSYFDGLLLHGGIVGGHPLRARLLTTPGRWELARRRRVIARDADAIVFVCDSTADRLREARAALVTLRASLTSHGRTPPVLVQANQQDRPGALTPSEVLDALGLPADADVVAASATTGAGVRETVLRAVRAAAAIAERQLVEQGEAGLPPVETDTDLLARLDGETQLRWLLPGTTPVPPLPDEEAPGGWTWPALEGPGAVRAFLRAMSEEPPRGGEEGDVIVVRAGDWCASTSLRWRFGGEGEARAAMVDRAREQVRRADIAPPDAALALASRGDGVWLWRITRQLTAAADAREPSSGHVDERARLPTDDEAAWPEVDS